LSRYANTDYVMQLDFLLFLQLLKKAQEEKDESALYSQWLALYPYMIMKQIKFMTYEDYKAKLTGSNIDFRTNDEIIAEIKAKHKEAFGNEVII